MKQIIRWTAMIIVLLASVSAAADPLRGMVAINGAMENCYQETVKATTGTTPEQLSTAACNRALRYLRSNDRKAVVLHNRGVIEFYKGDESAAAESWERAVAMADQVGVTHLALAQLTYRNGHYRRSLDLYEALLESDLDKCQLRAYEEMIVRGHQQTKDRWVAGR